MSVDAPLHCTSEAVHPVPVHCSVCPYVLYRYVFVSRGLSSKPDIFGQSWMEQHVIQKVPDAFHLLAVSKPSPLLQIPSKPLPATLPPPPHPISSRLLTVLLLPPSYFSLPHSIPLGAEDTAEGCCCAALTTASGGVGHGLILIGCTLPPPSPSPPPPPPPPPTPPTPTTTVLGGNEGRRPSLAGDEESPFTL